MIRSIHSSTRLQGTHNSLRSWSKSLPSSLPNPMSLTSSSALSGSPLMSPPDPNWSNSLPGRISSSLAPNPEKRLGFFFFFLGLILLYFYFPLHFYYFFHLGFQSEELKARLSKLVDMAERREYQELVKDITPKKNDSEPFSTYREQLGLGQLFYIFVGSLLNFIFSFLC